MIEKSDRLSLAVIVSAAIVGVLFGGGGSSS